ncbi:MAG: hypothetical protein JSW73_05835 [Candidatus Woesearchaeota archaeon]|nr:MAG: hypothetical protein JSW73_05835 [Candidatus Woesearchaeota archaeon]
MQKTMFSGETKELTKQLLECETPSYDNIYPGILGSLPLNKANEIYGVIEKSYEGIKKQYGSDKIVTKQDKKTVSNLSNILNMLSLTHCVDMQFYVSETGSNFSLKHKIEDLVNDMSDFTK